MNELNLASPLFVRQELEDCLRRKLEEAQERYRIATERYDRLLEESQGSIPNAASPLVSARHAKSIALDEYKQVLSVFTALTLNGWIPEQESPRMECDRERDKSDLSC